MFVVTAELVGPGLKRLREARGLTQAQLGALVEVSGSAVGQWEQGRTKPGWKQLQRLADVFGVTVVSPVSDPNVDWGDRLDVIQYDLGLQKEYLDQIVTVVDLTQQRLAELIDRLSESHLVELESDGDATPPD